MIYNVLIVSLVTLFGVITMSCEEPKRPSSSAVLKDMAMVAEMLDPEVDTDGDGYQNGIELRYGSDPRDPSSTPPDIDEDGIVDSEDEDIDNDGFANTIERRYETDPRDPASRPSDLDGDFIPDQEDPDRDGDEVPNADDDFPEDPLESRDSDRDGVGDVADLDDDNDGYSDELELSEGSDALNPNSRPADLDGDGIVDREDDDIDGDGVTNELDAFERDPNESRDNDRDGLGDFSDEDDDNDGFSDEIEQSLGSDPLDRESKPSDQDGDGIADALDSDRDGDGVENVDDAFPDDPTERSDHDADGQGDVADLDDDNDGYPDEVERVVGSDPFDANSRPLDLDEDGIPDAEDTDIDGDGVNNHLDAFPFDADESLDSDGDGLGDSADSDDDNDGYSDAIESRYGSDPLSRDSIPPDIDGDRIPDEDDEDRDGDGVSNAEDAFPDDPSESIDTDGDGVGNQRDEDDDGDGYSDLSELAAFSDPLDRDSRPRDLDQDGILDHEDDDMDGDGVLNVDDLFPRDPSEWEDLDEDGIGDRADLDDDGDGYADSVELEQGTDPLDANSRPTDIDGDQIPDSIDDDRDGDGYLNVDDSFPNDRSEWSDHDDDLLGDNADLDDDNDLFLDQDELTAGSDPLDASSVPADLDGDYIPDVIDEDLDGDTVINLDDAFPNDPLEWSDFDGDELGDNSDLDDDNDDYPDELELSQGTNPRDSLSTPPDIDRDLIPDSLDPDRDGDGYLNLRDAFPNDPTRWEAVLDDESFADDYVEIIPPNAVVEEYDSARFSLVRGSVVDQQGTPLAGLQISVYGHPEYGTAQTNEQGEWLLPVNGGGAFTFRVTDPLGSPTIDRNIDIPNNDIVVLEAIEITTLDSAVTSDTIDGDPHSAITHQNEGFEAPLTVVIPKDVVAIGTRADGSKEQLQEVDVRVTEYQTPEGMPASLPPSSLFTLCFEFTIDGFEHVEFSKPVTVWVPNFLGFNVGDAVPFGYYDRTIAAWVPLPDGVIVSLLDLDGDGFVDAVDATGDGAPNDLDQDGDYSDEVFGVEESPGFVEGAHMWRLITDHFSPLDPNYPTGPCPTCDGPPGDDPEDDDEGPNGPDAPDNDTDDECSNSGTSRVNVRDRTLHQDVPLLGTPLSLHYNSEWVDGFKIPVEFKLSSSSVNESLKGIKARYGIAGQVVEEERPPLPNQFGEILWDGRDFLGNSVTGKTMAWAEVSFVYRPYYYTNRAEALNASSSFAGRGTQVSGAFTRGDVTLSRRWEFPIYRYSAWGQGVRSHIAPGWGLGGYYTYDASTRTVIDGAGRRLEATDLGKTVTTVNQGALPIEPSSIMVDDRSDLYFIDDPSNRSGYEIFKLQRKQCGCPDELGGGNCVFEEPISICDLPGCVSTEGLSLWLDATALGLEDGTPIESWPSRLNLEGIASQDVESRRPLFVRQGIMDRPALSFDGIDDRLDLNVNQLAGANKTIITVLSSRRDGGFVWGASSVERGESLSVEGQSLITEYDGAPTTYDAPSSVGSPWIVTRSVSLDNGDGFLQGRWDFEDPDEPGLDSLGQNTGELLNDAAVVEDEERGRVLYFPNQSSMMNIPTIDIDNSWTFSAWFKNLKPQGNWRTLFRGGSDHQIIVDYNSTLLGLYGAGTSFTNSGYEMSTLDPIDGWHQLTAVGVGGETIMYIDGVEVGRANRQSIEDIRTIGNCGCGNQTFAEYLDDVRIYDIAFSPEKVAELYHGNPSFAQLSTFVNGRELDQETVDLGASVEDLKLTIGARDGLNTGSAESPFEGEIAEIIAFDRSLSGEERLQIEAELAARYRVVSFWDEECKEGAPRDQQENEVLTYYTHSDVIDDIAADPRGGLVFSSGPMIYRLNPGEERARAIANLNFEYYECFATQGDYCRVEVAVDIGGYIRAVSRYQGEYSSGNHLSLISPDGTVVRFPLNFYCVVGDLAVASDGASLISCVNGPVRRLDPNGGITTLPGWDPDCQTPNSYSGGYGMAVNRQNEVFLADRRCHRVSKIDPTYGANAYLGSGESGYSGDGGPLLDAKLATPLGVALSPKGELFVADSHNGVIRQVQKQKLGVLTVPNGETFIPKGDGTILVFSDTHILKAVRSVYSGQDLITYTYDDELRLVSVNDRGKVTTFINREEDPNQIAQLVGPYGETTSFEYDEAGRLSEVIREDGSSYRFGYNSVDLMMWKDTPNGHRSRYAYDNAGRLVSTNLGGINTSYVSGRAGGTSSRAVTTIEPMGQRSYVEESAQDGSKQVRKIGLSGDEMRAALSSDGSQMTLSEPNGLSTELVKKVDPLDDSTFTGVMSQTLPSGKRRVFGEQRLYDPESGERTVIKSTNGVETERIHFDRENATLTHEFLGLGAVTTLFDSSDHQRPLQQSRPGLIPMTYHYDEEGQLSQLRQGEKEVNFSYDDRGRLNSLTSGGRLFESYEYDVLGRLTDLYLADGRRTQYQYSLGSSENPLGQLTRLTREDGLTVDFTYNERDQLTSMTRGESGLIEYFYDQRGLLTRIVMPDQHERTISYVDGLISSVNSTETQQAALYLYQSDNRLSRTVTHFGISQTYEWDGPALSEIRWTGHPNLGVQHEYNEQLKLIATSYGGERTDYRYDDLGRLSGQGALSFGFDETTLLRRSISDHVGQLSWLKDQYGRTYQRDLEVNGLTLTRRITHELSDLISETEITFPSGESSRRMYTIDEALQLTEVSDGEEILERYTYDAMGHRLSSVHSEMGWDGEPWTWAYDLLLSSPDATFSYDANGQRVSREAEGERTEYEYIDGFLSKVHLPSGSTIKYRYGFGGILSERELDGVVTHRYLYDAQGQLQLVANGQDQVIERYDWAERRPQRVTLSNGQSYWISTDHLGTVQHLVDQNGTLVKSFERDSFGNLLSEFGDGPAISLSFALGIEDQMTGLITLGQRVYDPQVGLFIQPDPIGVKGGEDLYRYAANAPHLFTDRLGFSPGDKLTSLALESAIAITLLRSSRYADDIKTGVGATNAAISSGNLIAEGAGVQNEVVSTVLSGAGEGLSAVTDQLLDGKVSAATGVSLISFAYNQFTKDARTQYEGTATGEVLEGVGIGLGGAAAVGGVLAAILAPASVPALAVIGAGLAGYALGNFIRKDLHEYLKKRIPSYRCFFTRFF